VAASKGEPPPQLRMLQCLICIRERDQEGAAALYHGGVDKLIERGSTNPIVARLSEWLHFELEGGHRPVLINPQNTKAGDALWFGAVQRARRGESFGSFGPHIQAWLRRDLNRIADICQQEQVPLLLFNYPNQFVSSTIEAVAAERKLPCVDIESHFRDLPERETYFVSDGHPNSKGYALMAALITPEVLRMLPPPAGTATSHTVPGAPTSAASPRP
jgi:hypothetical protein